MNDYSRVDIEKILADPDLDPEIKPAVECLLRHGILTTASCAGHGLRMPFITFVGTEEIAQLALSVAVEAGFRVSGIYHARYWIGGHLVGPVWEIRFDEFGDWKTDVVRDRSIVRARRR